MLPEARAKVVRLMHWQLKNGQRIGITGFVLTKLDGSAHEVDMPVSVVEELGISVVSLEIGMMIFANAQ
ncbi:hypothetical protein LINGRAPRIM_LOCUS1789 [Linum grandiflorum]